MNKYFQSIIYFIEPYWKTYPELWWIEFQNYLLLLIILSFIIIYKIYDQNDVKENYHEDASESTSECESSTSDDDDDEDDEDDDKSDNDSSEHSERNQHKELFPDDDEIEDIRVKSFGPRLVVFSGKTIHLIDMIAYECVHHILVKVVQHLIVL
jgi:hypothetical protein